MVRIESCCGQNLEVSHRRDIRADSTRKETWTWMSRWIDRQSRVVTTSGMFGVRICEQIFPPNIRVIGDSTKLAYSCPRILQFQVQRRRMGKLTHHETLMSHLSLARLRRLTFFYVKCSADRLMTTNRSE